MYWEYIVYTLSTWVVWNENREYSPKMMTSFMNSSLHYSPHCLQCLHRLQFLSCPQKWILFEWVHVSRTGLLLDTCQFGNLTKIPRRPLWLLVHLQCHKEEENNTISHTWYLSFFIRAKFLENEIYTKKTRKLRQNTQKIAIFLRYYGKIHSKLPIFRVKSVKIYTGQKKFTRAPLVGSWQISGMRQTPCFVLKNVSSAEKRIAWK